MSRRDRAVLLGVTVVGMLNSLSIVWLALKVGGHV